MREHPNKMFVRSATPAGQSDVSGNFQRDNRRRNASPAPGAEFGSLTSTVQPKVTFLSESVKAFAMTQSVLSFFEREPQRGDEFDFRPFVDAMLTLGRDYRRDESGVGFLRGVVDVFDLIRPPFRGATDEQLLGGLQGIACYMKWIRDTFPDARNPRLERN